MKKSKISVLLKCIYIFRHNYFRNNYFRNSLAHYNENLFNDSLVWAIYFLNRLVRYNFFINYVFPVFDSNPSIWLHNGRVSCFRVSVFLLQKSFVTVKHRNGFDLKTDLPFPHKVTRSLRSQFLSAAGFRHVEVMGVFSYLQNAPAWVYSSKGEFGAFFSLSRRQMTLLLCDCGCFRAADCQFWLLSACLC